MNVTRERATVQQREPWYHDGLRVNGMTPAELDELTARRKEEDRRARQLMAFISARAARPRRDPACLRRSVDEWTDPDLAELVADVITRWLRLADALDRIGIDPCVPSCDALVACPHVVAFGRDERRDTVPPAPAHALRLTATLKVAACAPNGCRPSSLAA